MEATVEPFTMSYELMLHSSDAVHSLPGSAQHHNSSAPEPIITAYPFCHAHHTRRCGGGIYAAVLFSMKSLRISSKLSFMSNGGS